MTKVIITRWRDVGETKCLDCDRFGSGYYARELVRQHVRKTGHIAQFTVRHVTEYRTALEAP